MPLGMAQQLFPQEYFQKNRWIMFGRFFCFWRRRTLILFIFTVKEERIGDHVMHSEFISVSEDAARIINERRAAGGRTVAVGTTSCRTLESVSDADGTVRPYSGDTGIFIYPGYEFKATDALITNFHLPESTLLMLVSAFAGRERMLAAYDEAVRERYRFFSFGDAMLIV